MPKPVLGLLVWLAATLFFSSVSRAHTSGLSRSEYRVDEELVRTRFVFAERDFQAALPEGPEAMVRNVEILADGVTCNPRFESSHLLEQDGREVRAAYLCDHLPRSLSVDARFLREFGPEHRHLATVLRGDTESPFVKSPGDTSFSLDVNAVRSRTSFFSLLKLGAVHILEGYDHILFLFGILLARTRLRAIVFAISAFTVGHALSLAAATFGLVAISPRLVEPAIALSIAYVGAEHALSRPKHRALFLALPFGLIHGLGFAGALRELDLHPRRLGEALLSFNLGVELGQLAVVLALALPLRTLQKKLWFSDKGTRVLGALLFLFGVGLAALRAFATTSISASPVSQYPPPHRETPEREGTKAWAVSCSPAPRR